MSTFLTELKDKPSERDGFFLLTAPLIYDSDLAGIRITVETGFETNYVTGRKLLVVRRIVQDKMNRAAAVHDKCYEGLLPRSMADAVFYEAMIVCGVAKWRACLAYASVRACGWMFYNSQPQQPAEA